MSNLPWERLHEAHVPTEQPTSTKDARIPRPHAQHRRTERPQAPPRQGARSSRLVKGPSNARFEVVFAQGRRANGPLLRVIAFFPGSGLVGIATAKKIGDRPARNRAKRRVREAVRLLSDPHDLRLDYVVVVSPAAANAPFSQIQEELARLVPGAKERWAEELGSS